MTGANSGLGLKIAHALANMVARVVLACRSIQKWEEAKRNIVKATGNDQVEVEVLDCASFKSVHEFVEHWEQRELKEVSILVNNAGARCFSLVY